MIANHGREEFDESKQFESFDLNVYAFNSNGNAMLVLSRKVGERILVGDDITITVVRLTNGGVRIGIDAPQEMPVVREEVVRDGVSAKKQPKKRELARHRDRVTAGASEH